ncbi:T9SS type A sorting domain-containing protein [bacterium]|nr:T9SS type A sorting domain-containing protein [bacterium]
MSLKLRNAFLAFVFLLSATPLAAQMTMISGQLSNGRGTAEKLDRVRIEVRVDGQLLKNLYTDTDGVFLYQNETGLSDGTMRPAAFQLLQNYPNPFVSETQIAYSLNKSGSVTLEIFNVLGQRVRSLVQGEQFTGTHQLRWDRRDDSGCLCAHGMYFYRLTFDGQFQFRKMCTLNGASAPVSGHAVFPAMPKVMGTHEVVFNITDRDLQDSTITMQFDELPETIDVGLLQMHVHPFVRVKPEPVLVMAGEAAHDTLDIYFEAPIEFLSNDTEISWAYTADSLIAMTYHKINQDKLLFKVKEIDQTRTTYITAYFTLQPRLGIKQAAFHRAYLYVPFAESILLENVQGRPNYTMDSVLPDQLDFSGGKIIGTPSELFQGPVYFTVTDSRQITVMDSVLMRVNEPFNIDFNSYDLEMADTYPRDGTHPYSWVNGYTGVTQNLYYKGERIAKANPNGSKSAYCCGLTFEDFFRSIQQLNSDLGKGEDVNGMTVSDMKYFINIWFVLASLGDGPGMALETFGLGEVVYSWDDVKPGDYVQLWRSSGSGHSVIFVNWLTNSTGDKIGFRYWSTQTSTNGISYNNEYFQHGGGRVLVGHTFFSRVYSPENFKSFSRANLPNYEQVVSDFETLSPRIFMKN